MADSAADGVEGSPGGGIDDGVVRPAPGRRGRVAVAAAVVLLLVVLAARGTGGGPAEEVLSLPATGSVRPELLANGTPVFVVHTAPVEVGNAPTVDVMQAFTTELADPVTELVGWCAASQQMVAGHHGPLYDFRGRRMPAAVDGRLPAGVVRADLTALDDLVHRASAPIQGRIAEGEPLQVGGTQPLQPWQVQQRPKLDPVVPPEACRVGAADNPVVDHGFLAGTVDPGQTGWQITDGWLAVGPDGRASWCDVEPVVEALDGTWGTRCEEPRADLSIGFGYDPADVGLVPAVLGGPLAARLRDGVVQRVAVLAGSAWRGSSLQGTQRYIGGFVDLDVDRGVASVRGLAGGGGELCLSALPGPLTNQAVGTNVAVTGDTVLLVDGVADPRTIADAPPAGSDGARVEVVLDAVTCDALSITDAG